ncbi:Hypp989 [Branchiostoma lanceolatum]|uniref:Hypp989 protein n=1 Tax=Branchiostoma lanceolatum TaxID=7740 RepID=A0A8K0EIJ0_BRALA|nr:Hypp989 [Branchiostoma lanceolatum]
MSADKGPLAKADAGDDYDNENPAEDENYVPCGENPFLCDCEIQWIARLRRCVWEHRIEGCVDAYIGWVRTCMSANCNFHPNGVAVILDRVVQENQVFIKQLGENLRSISRCRKRRKTRLNNMAAAPSLPAVTDSRLQNITSVDLEDSTAEERLGEDGYSTIRDEDAGGFSRYPWRERKKQAGQRKTVAALPLQTVRNMRASVVVSIDQDDVVVGHLQQNPAQKKEDSESQSRFSLCKWRQRKKQAGPKKQSLLCRYKRVVRSNDIRSEELNVQGSSLNSQYQSVNPSLQHSYAEIKDEDIKATTKETTRL